MKKKVKIPKYAKGGMLELDALDAGDPTNPAPTPVKSATPSRIPLPNYQDAKSRLNYAKAFRQKYGSFMQGRGDTPLRINEVPESSDQDTLTSKEIAIRSAKGVGLDPALLYASAMEEGMSGLYSNGKGDVEWSGDEKFPIDGYVNFGLDTFSDAYPGLVKKGYLPADFKNQFKKSTRAPRAGDNKVAVNSANFTSAQAALQAKAAMIRSTQDEIDAYTKKTGINLSDRGRQFFTYLGYNAGMGNAQKMIQDYSRAGALKDDAYLKARPTSGQGLKADSWATPYENTIRRLQMADALKNEGYFQDGGRIPNKAQKYPDGGEIDPITGQQVFKESGSKLGVNVWDNAATTPTPINPDAPQDQQIFPINQQQETQVQGNPIVPLSQFYDTVNGRNGQQLPQGTGNYVNDQGQVNTVDEQQSTNNILSQQNLATANRNEKTMDDIEMGSSLGITAINAFFNKRNSAQERRKDRRKAILQETFAPLYNPYAEGTGSQAIMEYGGEISDQQEPVRKYKLEDKREINPATGKPFKKMGMKTVDVDEVNLKKIISHAKAMGVDPYTALAIAYQETNIGASDKSDLGRAIDADFNIPSSVKDEDIPAYDLVKTLKSKMSYADDLVKKGKLQKDEAYRIQVYNGLGKLSPNSEERSSSYYEIPVSKDNPLDLSKNPAYGKTIISLRDDILKKNSNIKKLIDQTEAFKYEFGGSIHIKPENRGKFTAAANRAGKSVQGYAAQILAHPDNYSPTLRKRANFARNAAKWHEQGGEIEGDDLGIQTLDGGKSTLISSSNHSNPMIEFTGREHKDGGIGIQYGGNIAEVENKEVGWIDQEGGLNIFGKLKLPGTNQTFRKTAKDIADQEKKVDGLKSKYLNILNNSNPVDPYQESAQSTAKVMFKSLDKQSKEIAEKKEALADYQNLILAMADEQSAKMGYGGKMPKKPKYFADGGELENGPTDPIVKAKLKKDFTKGERDLSKIKSVVLHKTAGTSKAADIISGWNNDNRQASADFIIDQDGTITQVGDIEDTKWHAGIKGVNQTTLGVEIVGSADDESDMTPAQYQALKRLNKDVFEPMGITPNDYYGHTQVNKKKGFDFAKPDSIKNVLAKAGISNSYTPDVSRFDNILTSSSDNAGADPYPKAFKQFKSKNGTQYTSPQGLSPEAFYKDPDIVKALEIDKTFPKAADDANWGIEHQRVWDNLSQTKKDQLLAKSNSNSNSNTNTNTNTNVNTLNTDNFVPNYSPINQPPGSINTKYGAATRSPTLFSDKVNLGNGDRARGFLSPLAIEQIAPELLTLSTSRQDPVEQLTYQPELKQTFDISYQLGRNENQSSFNQVAKIAESTGNIGALSQLAAQKYKADETYNNQEVQGNAMQKLQVYGQNTDVLNDAKLKNLALLSDQQTKQAQAKFNTRKEDLASFASISGKVLQNNLENRTYNAYANLFKHYGFDKKGNVTFNPDQVVQRFNAGEAQQFGLMAAQQGAGAIVNGDFSRKFTKTKNADGSQTTTETYGTNQKIQSEYKTLKAQGFDDGIIGNMLRAKYPETINQD